jgi:DNA helicase-2/ATP-dependent DNA helicase PcrA
MQDARYDQLTASQKKAVFHTEGPLLVIAGPGSGKTRVITCRIAALIDSGVRPYNICAITFTNKAAEEMRQRASSLGASIGAHISTFHSLCVRLLRRYAGPPGMSNGTLSQVPVLPIKPNFSIYDEADQARCMKQAIKDCELDAKSFSPARCLEAISAMKNNLIDAEAYAAEADDFFSKTLARIYSRYQQILQEHNALDFDDLLVQAAFLLERYAHVREELGRRFRFLLIDEYQDTNHAQYRIARALAREHGNICVTGDPDQSIYRWRGADIRNILSFEQDWPDAVIVKLEENFRSTPNILRAADNLIEHNHNRKEKKLVPTRPAGSDVRITVAEDEKEEASLVAKQVQELLEKGISGSEIAVFYRVNSMSRPLEEAFIRSKISYQVVRGVEFYNRKEIRDIVAYLKVLANPSDEIALLRIINTPPRGIGKTTIDRMQAHAKLGRISLYDALKTAATMDALSQAARAKTAVFVSMLEQLRKDINGPVAPLAERVFIESGLEQYLKAGDLKDQSALDNVNELINAAAEYDKQTQEPSLVDYLQQIALFSDSDAYDSASERVALMTLHAAKGLEFDHVFIIGLEEGILPHERSSSDEHEKEEERRLLFVGITRSRTGLGISYAHYRAFRGQILRTIPSQFLAELGIAFEEQAHRQQDEYDDMHDETSQVMPEFVRGQMVRHKKFGLGTVKEYIDMGENSVITVKFNSGQLKTLMVKYANLFRM